jgi:hypothetical protein
MSLTAANCVAWVRVGDENHDGCVTVICNGKEDGEKRCEVGKEHAGEKWTDVLGWHQGEITIEEGMSFASTDETVLILQMDGLLSHALPRVFQSGPRLMPGAERNSRRIRR